MADYTLCFVFEGTNNLGFVKISKDDQVHHLRGMIYSTCANRCRDIDVFDLILLEVCRLKLIRPRSLYTFRMQFR